MYSKPKTNQESSFRIPENYSGNAFQGDTGIPSVPVDPPLEPPSIPTEEKQPGEATAVAMAVLPPNKDNEEKSFSRASPFSSLLPPRLTGSRGGLLGDIGVEELLIIGILILLSQSDADDDILLLLMLLLFYK